MALEMGHDERAMQFLRALGTNPSTNYNRPSASMGRQGAFCLAGNLISEPLLGRGVEDESNVTWGCSRTGIPAGDCMRYILVFSVTPHPIMVVYCVPTFNLSADLSLFLSSICKNDTSVTAIPFTGLATHRSANMSTADGYLQCDETGHDDNHGHGHGHGYGSESDSDTTGADSGPADSIGAAVVQITWDGLGFTDTGGLVVALVNSL
ncbi:putative GPI anchored protein [Aspergillus undulatus]|uniref:putative GPI anchored protein n=1 Tax=Aspergillus undulatus TaxID=1810928 RepID=UPI003CCD26D6